MMTLSNDQIASLLSMITNVEQDDLNCDNCFEHVSEFAEAELTNRDVPDALRAVKVHLQQCPCCKEEYTALLKGLRELEVRG